MSVAQRIFGSNDEDWESMIAAGGRPTVLVRDLRTSEVPSEYGDTQSLIMGMGAGLFLMLVGEAAAQIVASLSEPGNILLVLASLIGGILGADFVSGILRWAAETWGKPTRPIVGNVFIRLFREHDPDPKAITRHDFMETIGANCLVTLPALLVAVLLYQPTTPRLSLTASLTSLSLWVLARHRFHQWAHENAPPRLLRALQKLHFVPPQA
jgi:CRP-like cAMP-binding protein